EWSGSAQERLKAASAIVVGAGALGSPVALYLAAAGVGRIGVVDHDAVELSEANAEAIVMGADVVVDCSDSFPVRYAVNDACCAQGVPLVEAGVLGFAGLVMAIRPGESACYR